MTRRGRMASIAVLLALLAGACAGSIPLATSSASLALDRYAVEGTGVVEATLTLAATGFPEQGLYGPSPSPFEVDASDAYPFVGFVVVPIATIAGATYDFSQVALGDGSWAADAARGSRGGRGGSGSGGHGGRGTGSRGGSRGSAVAFGGPVPLTQLDDLEVATFLTEVIEIDPLPPLPLIGTAFCGEFGLYAALALDSDVGLGDAIGVYVPSPGRSWRTLDETPGFLAASATPGDVLQVTQPIEFGQIGDTAVFRIWAVTGRLLDRNSDGAFQAASDMLRCDSVMGSTVTVVGRSGVPESIDAWVGSVGSLGTEKVSSLDQLEARLSEQGLDYLSGYLKP